jgi:tape measure domain-containing protein
VALELDPLVQRITWDSAQFEAGLQRSQTSLRTFQQAMASGAQTVGLGGAGGAQQLTRIGQAAQLTASHLISAQRAVRDFAASQQGLAAGQIQRLERSWFLTGREILGAQRAVTAFAQAQQQAAAAAAQGPFTRGLGGIGGAQQGEQISRTQLLGAQSGVRQMEAQAARDAARSQEAQAAAMDRTNAAAARLAAQEQNLARTQQQSARAWEATRIAMGGEEAVAARLERRHRELQQAFRDGHISHQRAIELYKQSTIEIQKNEKAITSLGGRMRRFAPLFAGAAVAQAVPGIGGFALGQAVSETAGARLGVGTGAAAAGIVGGVAAGVAAAKIAQAGDSIRTLQAQLESFLGSAENARIAFEGIVNAATSTGTPLDANAVLFRRLAIAQEDLGASTQELVQFQTLVQQSLIASGAATTEAAAGSQQLAQAMASGKLQGDEFRSVMENMPVLARQIAKGLFDMGKTTEPTIGALNELRESGRLLAEDVFEALLRQGTDIKIMFDAMPQTMERAATSMATNWQLLAAELDRVTGASGFFRSTLNAMNEDLQETIEFVKTLGTTPANIDQKISDMQDKIALAQQSKSQFLDAPSAGGFGAELQGLAGDVSVLQGELNELVRLKQQFEFEREPGLRIGQALATAGLPRHLQIQEPRLERPALESTEDLLKRNQQTAGDLGRARDKADAEAHRKALARIEERQDMEEKFQLELARLSEKEDPLDPTLETARIMQRLLRDMDFPPDAATVARMREQVHLGVLNAREAKAAADEEERRTTAVEEAMAAQRQRQEAMVMSLPGVGSGVQARIRESDIADLQAKGQITPRQAGQLLERSETEQLRQQLEELPPALQAVHAASIDSVDALSNFTVGLATGTQQLSDFGDTMLDISRIILRQVIQQTVVEPTSNALITGLTAFAAQLAPPAAGAVGQPGTAPTTTTGPGGAGFSRPTSFGGPRQHGGPVDPRRWYLTGEHGPEAFVPHTSGSIVPMSRGGGSASPVFVNVNNSSGSQVAVGKPRVAAGGGRIIDVAVQDSVSRMATGGGLDPLLRNSGVRRRGTARM